MPTPKLDQKESSCDPSTNPGSLSLAIIDIVGKMEKIVGVLDSRFAPVPPFEGLIMGKWRWLEMS